MRLLALFFLLMLCCLLILFHMTAGLIQNIYILQTYEPPTQHIEIIDTDKLNEMDERLQELEDVLSSAQRYTVTAYAPLDPNAIEGFSYSGDPNATASGGRPIPYQTVAASREFEFGQRLWVEGVGVVEVNDRGGAIKGKRLDLVLPTRDEALIWGRRDLRVIPL